MRIRHVINVVGKSARPDLLREQAITIDTIELARRIAPDHLDVEVVGVRFSDEEQPTDWMVDRWLLERSVLDMGDFRRRRRLPLLRDVLRPFEDGEFDLGIYTNIDIAVQPRFYELVTEIHERGHDAFVINRRTVEPNRPGHVSVAWLTHQVGSPHPGHDCFGFTPSVFGNAEIDDVCLGTPYVMRPLLYSMMLMADKFRDFTDLHATFHVGDDRTWIDPSLDDYRDHNTAALQRSIGRLIDRYGRDAVARLPDIRRHLRAIDGQVVDPRGWARPNPQRRQPRSFGQRRLIFAGSPGRCGSEYLAELLGTAHEVVAAHEPEPTMTGQFVRDIAFGSAAESYARRSIKADALRARQAELPIRHVYAETTHMFVKTFADVVLDEFNHDLISVVHLHRPLHEIVNSMASLGWFTPLAPAWRDWLITPTAPGAMFRIDLDDVESHLDLVIGYILDTETRTRALRHATPGVRWVDADVSRLGEGAGLADLFSALDLTPTDRTRHQVGRRVNDRSHRKRQISAGHTGHDVTAAINSFMRRFWTLIEAASLEDMFEAVPASDDLEINA